jgi:hypothetical protein
MYLILFVFSNDLMRRLNNKKKMFNIPKETTKDFTKLLIQPTGLTSGHIQGT